MFWGVMYLLTAKYIDPLSAISFDPPFITNEFKYRLPDVGAADEGMGRDSQDKSHVR